MVARAHVIILAFDAPKTDNPIGRAVPLRALLPVDSVAGKSGQVESSIRRQLQIFSGIPELTVTILTSNAGAVRENIKGWKVSHEATPGPMVSRHENEPKNHGVATDGQYPKCAMDGAVTEGVPATDGQYPKCAMDGAVTEGVQVEETPSLSAEVLKKIIRALDDDVPLLFVQGNLPFIESGEIRWILEQTVQTRSLLMFLVESRLLPAGIKKKTGTFREGTFAAGAGCAITAGLARQTGFLKDIENIVRSPFAFAASFGAGFLLKFALGRLSLKDVEVAGTEKIGIPLKILPLKSPGLALTVK